MPRKSPTPRKTPKVPALEIEALIRRSVTAWRPPANFVDPLDVIVRHNAREPNMRRRVGPDRAAEWCEKHGLTVSSATLYRYFKTRAQELNLS